MGRLQRRPAVLNVAEKGKRFERSIVKDFKSIGFKRAATTRATSKLLDNCKVDINGIPYYIQCKNGYLKGLNYSTIFKQMKELITENYDKVEYPLIILHKKGGKYEDTLAVLPYKDLLEMINKIYKCENIGQLMQFPNQN